MMLALLWPGACAPPAQTDRACAPPLKTWGEPHPHLGPVKTMIPVGIDHDGATYLNGKRVSLRKLSTELRSIAAWGDPQPAVVLETEAGAPCATIDRVRVLMDEHLQCQKAGHCDEGVQTIWRNLPYTGSGVP